MVQDRKQIQNYQNMTARKRQLRQDNRDGTTTAVTRGYMGHDIQLGQGIGDRTTVPIERGHLGLTSGTGPLGEGSWDRTTRRGQLGQDIRDRTVGTGQSQQVGQTGSLDR